MQRLNFNNLSATDFEDFSFHLLSKLGFVNVDWRKGTPLPSSPSDRGRDIVCQHHRADLDNTHHLETWFVDCKRFKTAVSPRELQNALAWAEAERPDVLLFILSGFLSNPAKDYLEKYGQKNRQTFRIKF
jgi:HJR/Mrr/RecB family endonuclease